MACCWLPQLAPRSNLSGCTCIIASVCMLTGSFCNTQDDAVSCLVLGTESSQVLVLNPQANQATHIWQLSHVPAFICTSGQQTCMPNIVPNMHKCCKLNCGLGMLVLVLKSLDHTVVHKGTWNLTLTSAYSIQQLLGSACCLLCCQVWLMHGSSLAVAQPRLCLR